LPAATLQESSADLAHPTTDHSAGAGWWTAHSSADDSASDVTETVQRIKYAILVEAMHASWSTYRQLAACLTS